MTSIAGLPGISIPAGFANAIGVAIDLRQHDFVEETRAACAAMFQRPVKKQAAAS